MPRTRRREPSVDSTSEDEEQNSVDDMDQDSDEEDLKKLRQRSTEDEDIDGVEDAVSGSEDDDSEDDDAPAEVKNVASDEYQPATAEKAKRKRRRVRKEAIEAPEDDVLEKARLARLHREEGLQKEQAKLLKEFEEDDLKEVDEEVRSRPTTVTIAVASMARAKQVKANDGALHFARTSYLGNAKRVSLAKYRSQKLRGPTLQFTTSKRKKTRGKFD